MNKTLKKGRYERNSVKVRLKEVCFFSLSSSVESLVLILCFAAKKNV